MPETIAISQFERRLVAMGCPARRVKENVRELAEHFEDLKQAGLEEGLSEHDAEARATAQLGDPIILAENAMGILRQSSWWGRHPFIVFCVMPVLAFELAWTLCVVFVVFSAWLLGKVFGGAYLLSESDRQALSGHPEAFQNFTETLNVTVRLLAIFLVIFIFSRLARRAAVGLKWMLAVCLACASLNLFSDYMT